MTRAKTLRFHAATFELVGKKARRSPGALELLKERERRCGVKFPAAVREWYVVGGPELGLHIGCGKTTDWMVLLPELGQPIEMHRMETADLVRRGLLVVIHENQGVCTWAVKLDGSDDPPVVVEVDSSNDATSLSEIRWQRCAESFSTFMYCRAWDRGHSLDRISNGLAAQDQPLARRDLAFLRANFAEGPRTFGHPAAANYRFYTADSAILIGTDKRYAEWQLMASSDEALLSLLRSVSHCGTLTQTLYAFDDVRVPLWYRLRELRPLTETSYVFDAPRSDALLWRSIAKWTRFRKRPASRKQARRNNRR